MPQNQSKDSKGSIILADDHAGVLDGLEMIFTSLGYTVLAKFTELQQVLPAIKQLRPDVLVTDVRFDRLDTYTGVHLLKDLPKHDVDVAVVFWSQFDNPAFIEEAYSAGAIAYLTKIDGTAEIAAALENAMAGKQYFPPRVAQILAQAQFVQKKTFAIDPKEVLDDRGFEMFLLFAEGATQQEVAEKLGLTTRSVTKRYATIKTKLSADNLVDLAKIAIRFGYASIDE